MRLTWTDVRAVSASQTWACSYHSWECKTAPCCLLPSPGQKLPSSLVTSFNQQDQKGNTSLSTWLSRSGQKTVDQLWAKERGGLAPSSHSATQTYLIDSGTFSPPSATQTYLIDSGTFSSPSSFKLLLVMRLIFPVAFNSLDLTDTENVTKNL